MPRKIVNTESFDESGSAMGQNLCPMCGSLHTGEPGETDRAEHPDLDVIRQIAAFMKEDWKACAVLLLYVSSPNAPVRHIAEHITLGIASICSARQRAADRFPDLAGMLGLKTPQAIAQQAYFAFRKESSTGDTDVSQHPTLPGWTEP